MRKMRGISKSAHPRRDARPEYAIVNLGQLRAFSPGAEVGPKEFIQAGLVKRIRDGVRVLGDGDIDRPLHLLAHHFSSSARQKIEAAGGTATLLPSG
jgi:large subunit ribosomal protein L15